MQRNLRNDLVEGAGAVVGGYGVGVIHNLPALKKYNNLPLLISMALVLGSIYGASMVESPEGQEMLEGVGWGSLGVLSNQYIYPRAQFPQPPTTTSAPVEVIWGVPTAAAAPVTQWEQPGSAGGMSVLEI